MIRVEGLVVEVPAFRLEVDELEVEKGKYMVVMGPSGSGKTTLLEAIAGLREIASGKIYIEGEEATFLPPEKRGLSYVPQSVALWPHMTVFENIAFGLRVRRAKDVGRKVEEIAEVMGISHLLQRKPLNLSGGEKQRVALARALVVSPKAVLLDEPLSNLDLATAEKLKSFIKRLRRKVGFTAIHVTHDPLEAAELGDEIAVLYNGRVMAKGPTAKVMREPSVMEVFERFRPVILEGEVVGVQGEIVELEVSGSRVLALGKGCVEGARAIIAVRPEDVAVFRDPPKGGSAKNLVRCRLRGFEDRGSLVELFLDADGNIIRAMVTRGSFEHLEVRKGGEVYAVFKASATKVLRCFR